MTSRSLGSQRSLLRHAVAPLILGLAVLMVASCASPPPPPLPPRVDIPFGEGRIWMVERDGWPTSYMFGTLHVTDPRVLDLPYEVDYAFSKAEIAAFEAVDEPGKEPKRFDIEQVKLPEGTSLRSLIGARAWGQLVSIYKGRGYWKPRSDIKPWIFWNSLGGAWGTFYTNDREHDPDQPILDDLLEQRAKDEGKEVVGLETDAESFDIFDGMPMDIQVALLQTTLDHYHEHTYGIPRVQFYLDGDLSQSRALWEESLSWLDPEAAKVLDSRLLDDRNHIMVERMLPLMERAPTFVGVGAAHMPGEEGILRLLEKQGFKITKLL